DRDPGPARRVESPARPDSLRFEARPRVKVPGLGGMHDPHQRARILHALDNHELQAAELFAWALLAFPAAPAEYRRGLAEILDDEQRHTRMYIARLEALGHRFGDFPVTGYFWHKVPHIHSPIDFVSAMSLTFENANLDHTVEYAEAARAVGDEKTALVIERIGRDEVDHVRFGWRWLNRLKDPDVDAWDAWCEHLAWPLRPEKARGARFHPEGRRAAGLDETFIERLASSRD
ncbi:MAG: DUF455 family protein, partial [Acidobacteriota bacterium]